MIKHSLLLIGLIAVCIGNMHAMKQRQQRFTKSSYKQYLRPKSSFYTGYRYKPNLREWWQQPTQYELQLMKQQEIQLRKNIEEEQKRNDDLRHAWELCKKGFCLKANNFLVEKKILITGGGRKMTSSYEEIFGGVSAFELYKRDMLNQLEYSIEQSNNTLKKYDQLLQQPTVLEPQKMHPYPLYD